jgi:hypothetical protein
MIEDITAANNQYSHVHLPSEDSVAAGEWYAKELGFPDRPNARKRRTTSTVSKHPGSPRGPALAHFTFGVDNPSCSCVGLRFPLLGPSCTPFDLAPFTRAIPAASSGASSPLSAASTASFRTAVIRTLMETDPSPRASRERRATRSRSLS